MAELFIRFSKTAELDDVDYNLKAAIRAAIDATLDFLEFPYPAEVSVTLADNTYIHKLNKKHRGVDRHTDVLSFPMYEDGEFDDTCQSGALLGDIVISLERAREQAGELGHGFIREVAFLAIHSTLHLLGFDHERSKEEDELQCRLQKQIIEIVNIEEWERQ